MKHLVKKISRQNFTQILKKRETEDLDVVQAIDKLFLKKRGYVFKQAKNGEKVILLLSGGIDSTVAWETLIKLYNYQVYPVIIDRGSTKRAKKELAAVRLLEKYFAKKYPNNYVKPFHLTVNTISKEIFHTINQKNLYPQDILANFHQNKGLVNNDSNVIVVRTNGVSPYLMSFYGVMYSQYLNFMQGLDIKNIFVGVNSGDGILVPSQSFTALRSTLLGICTATGDYSWNFSSVFLERETGVFLDKGDVVKIGAKFGTPLEKTWSCYRDKLFQCGNACAACNSRKEAFWQAKEEDRTIYLPDIKKRILNSLKFHLKKIQRFFSL